MRNFDLEKVIAGCKKKCSSDQEELYKHCFVPMIKVSLRYTTNMEEATGYYNAAMLKVFNNLEQYRSEGEFLAWVRRIVVNTSITHLKQKSRFEYKELDALPENNYSSQPEIYSQLTAKEIMDVVQELPPNMKLVFNLSALEGYTHEKIGEVLGISKGTSKWYLHEARKQLKEKIKALFNHEITSNAI